MAECSNRGGTLVSRRKRRQPGTVHHPGSGPGFGTLAGFGTLSCGLWPSPEKAPLNARIIGRVERDGYSIEKAYFQTYPGFYLAGNLYRPLGKGSGPFPPVLNPHGHWPNGRMADTQDGSIAARCINFARQGMIAFSCDMVGYNDTGFPDWPQDEDFQKRHRRFATNEVNLLWNISLMGLQAWNSVRALDFPEWLAR